MKNYLPKVLILLSLVLLMQGTTFAQNGTWNTLTNSAPDPNGGVMLLLTDGTVMVLTSTGPSGYGNTWDLLTPDSKGSYLNGTWTTLPVMNDTRLYCGTQVLADGNVYVAGGEYGSGGGTGELYNTTTKTWKYITGVPNGWQMSDGNSEILPDGSVLQGCQISNSFLGSVDNLQYAESSGVYDSVFECLGSHDEASWVKLPDNSIMNVDLLTKNSERYIPSLKQWIADANLPVQIYDQGLGETGAGFLLPNGKLFFLSDSTYTAIYTPSGNNTPGTWAQGPAMPTTAAGVKLGCPDAPAAILPDGNILCAFSPAGTYNGDEYFYEYNYLTNKFTTTNVPAGPGDSISGLPAFGTNMLNLPDGTVLFSDQGDNQYYQYTSPGTPLASAKPVIDNIIDICPNFEITGKLFNGISEGSDYGDDWQSETNYPIVRFTSGTNVYYARTTNWNRIGAVMTDSLLDTAYFTIPTMPAGTYAVQLIANGVASSPYSVTLPCVPLGIQNIEGTTNGVIVYPNPSANGNFTLAIDNGNALTNSNNSNNGMSIGQLTGDNEKLQVIIYNILGEEVYSQLSIVHSQLSIDLGTKSPGVYFYRVLTDEGKLIGNGKLVIQK